MPDPLALVVSPMKHRKLFKHYYYYYRYSALGPVWAETRAQSGDWYGSGTLHPGQVLRGSLPLLINISAQFKFVFVQIRYVRKGKSMPISRLEPIYLMSEEYTSPALSSLLQVNVVRYFRIPPRSRCDLRSSGTLRSVKR